MRTFVGRAEKFRPISSEVISEEFIDEANMKSVRRILLTL